ncbi:transferase [Pelomonas sp. Root1217]|uniref:glycosyltransferase n=1 Tax=Pelomonas sp. Root1217 TaxID=1736430 RepID=UPI00070F7153|nr:glycosyltransferase [Pelomonas sp. Root1217]KQV46923.1 transferase [Pelomonas sp. Root1217]
MGSPLRVLVCHNRYQLRGGEDSVCESEVALLREHGHDVQMFERSNTELNEGSKLAAAMETIWSRDSGRAFRAALAEFRPQVVHVHNTFAKISPVIYWEAARAGVPIVQTLHNFRLLCPQAMFLREGKVCEDCLGKVPWRGAVRACYRGSVAQSTVLASMVTVHRAAGTWSNKVTRYIALNEFCRRKFIEGGLPADRIVLKPNFVDFDAPPAGSREGFLFVGRLSTEKGIETLVEAAKKIGSALIRVAGTGPEAHLLEGVPGVQALGGLDGDAVRRQMSASAALILPSIWYENFPRTLVEAMACGLPIIASSIGALAELVEEGVSGLLFEPGNAADLAAKLIWAQDNPEAMAAMGLRARAIYEDKFTARRNYAQLIEIYEDAIDQAMKDGLQ